MSGVMRTMLVASVLLLPPLAGAADDAGNARRCQATKLSAVGHISAVSLQDGEQGQAIASTCRQVTVYYSGADETLGSSNYEFFQYHRSDYPTRLGLIGPYYGFPAPKVLNPNVVGLDCSSVTVYPAVSSIIDVHSSYRSVPALLLDQAQTLLSLPQPKRAAIPGTAQGFTLQP